jgi:hypothetical protein
MFFTITIIGIVSILLAWRSLRQLEKLKEVESAKRSLKKGKVIYHRDSSASVDGSA